VEFTITWLKIFYLSFLDLFHVSFAFLDVVEFVASFQEVNFMLYIQHKVSLPSRVGIADCWDVKMI